MLERTEFEKKQIIFYYPIEGDKLSFRNDNLLITDKDGSVKGQTTCYRVFLLFIVGETSITTGLIKRAKKFGFSICFMNRNMKIDSFLGSRMEGNTLLRKHQYAYSGMGLGQHIIYNKIMNQRRALNHIRAKDVLIKEAIDKLDGYLSNLQNQNYERDSLLGVEGSASRVYFSQMFNNTDWRGRKPRIKSDMINTCLDIGYTILFNLIDALVNVYGFDEYYGVLHTCFYMRKSLICDLMEPFRPIIDYATRKAINLKQIKKEDFKINNGRYLLEWKKSAPYTKLYLTALLEYKNELFLYIRDYYRAFMKGMDVKQFPMFIFNG